MMTILVLPGVPVMAAPSVALPLEARAAVLIDQNTGNVLYARNAHERMYPAGLTKILTALVAIEYLDPDEVVVIGTEIYAIPAGAARAGHFSGESITVRNLLRALMLRSANDSGAVLALQTVQTQRQRRDIAYSQAERAFSTMMNDKARALGALNTHFTNPNGLHHDNHVTTAYDLALIARAYRAHPLLREIAAEREFIGDSLEGRYIEGARIREYTWVNNNELLVPGPFFFPYATGLRAGSTTRASDCLAASAERGGVQLISVVLYAADPARWLDTRTLFEHGFAHYAYHTVMAESQHMDTVYIPNVMLGGKAYLDVLSGYDFTALFSQAQLERLQRVLVFDERFTLPPQPTQHYGLYHEAMAHAPAVHQTQLLAPIQQGEALGTVRYLLDGQVLFEGPLLAAAAVGERSLDSDMDYYIAWVMDTFFSMRALPYWLGLAGALVGITGIWFAITERRRSRSWYYKR